MPKSEKVEFELRTVTEVDENNRIVRRRLQYRTVTTTSYITEFDPRGPYVSVGKWKSAKSIIVRIGESIPDD